MMKALFFALVAVACASLVQETAYDRFSQYRGQFKKVYHSIEDETHAFKCFQVMEKIIDEMNSKGAEKHGWNEFTDMCPEDFKTYHNLVMPKKPSPPDTFTPEQVANLTAGQSVDWRTKGAVTGIKNQGQCGSCWSFSATGNMEGQVFLKTGKLAGLSEEELVQCSHNGDMGCNGGLMDNAFEWVVQNGGIDSEANYPYTSGGGTTGSCDNSKLKQVVAKLTGHKDIAHSESQMASQVASGGPLSIGVDAASGWQTYMGGIMKNCNGRSLDHGVLIVGFDTSSSTPYWIVKNSWGTTWGEQGYIRLQYGTDQCGLTGQPSTSIAAGGPAPPPGPTPPPPPPGPTPTPPPPPGPAPQCGTQASFKQTQCSGTGCTSDCFPFNFPTNQCVPDKSGGSVQSCCSTDGSEVIEKVYTATDCSGTPSIRTRKTNECYQTTTGSGCFKDVCSQ